MVQQLVRALIETRGIHRVEDGVALTALEHRAAVDLVQAVGALELGAHQRVGLARAADAAGAAGAAGAGAAGAGAAGSASNGSDDDVVDAEVVDDDDKDNK